MGTQFAHVGGGGSSAAGAETAQAVGATLAAGALLAVVMLVLIGHRRGSVTFLRRWATFAERRAGLPGWAALPLALHGISLVVAVFGMYWDIATHIDAGRDPGPLANASHYFILAGLFGAFIAGLLAIFLPDERPGPAAVRLPWGLQAPLGGVLIFLCTAIALSAFPLDDLWHRAFGQDVTLWGPTHLLLFGGASLSVLGALMLAVEGARAARERQGRDVETAESLERMPLQQRLIRIGLAGAFLIALSTFQAEYDYAVPQYRLVMHPILLMLAASMGLVVARIYLGRGGALLAAAFFILIRGALALIVSPLFDHTTLHLPLYLVEAGVVELVALRIDPRRTAAFGAAAGAAIGTFGLAAEWAWSYVWWTIEWPASLLPEAAIAGFVSAVAGGVLGALVGRALTGEGADRAVSRLAAPLAGVAIIAVLVWAVPVEEGDPVRANVQVTEAAPGPERAVNMTVRLEPPDAADDAEWFNATAWQGGEGRSVVDELGETAPGVYRTTKPIPVHGNWKVTLRLQRGRAVDGMAVYFPEDKAIPAPGIQASPSFTREFVRDKKLLQREQKPGVSGALTTFGYLSVLLIAILLVGANAWGLARFGRTGRPAPDRNARPAPDGTAGSAPNRETAASS